METLVCEGLSKDYGQIRALDGIDLRLEEGKIIGLLGPNGSGKTTLIKLASRLLVPSEGRITICGEVPIPEHRHDDAVKEDVQGHQGKGAADHDDVKTGETVSSR